MATVLQADLIEGTTVTDDLSGGSVLVRTYLVEGVVGASSQKVGEALNATGVPALGDVHPNYPLMEVTSKSAEPTQSSNTIWKVTVNYGIPKKESSGTGSVATYSATLGAVQTTKDHSGAEMFTGTLPPNDKGKSAPKDYSAPPYKVPIQPALVEKLVPSVVVTASRLETSLPTSALTTMIGKINSDAVTINGTVFGVKTLLLTSVNATTEDKGTTYSVSYEFQYKSSWDITVVGIDPDTGSPWASIDQVTDGTKPYQLYEDVIMNTLNL
jgi:hypothetical protein